MKKQAEELSLSLAHHYAQLVNQCTNEPGKFVVRCWLPCSVLYSTLFLPSRTLPARVNMGSCFPSPGRVGLRSFSLLFGSGAVVCVVVNPVCSGDSRKNERCCNV